MNKKGKRIAEFRWDVYLEFYNILSLSDLEFLEPEWRQSEDEIRFLAVPYLAVRWPATPDITTDGPISPPWKGRRLPQTWQARTDFPPSKRYQPFSANGLYREFAELACTDESILRFARQYGHLGLATLIGYRRSDDPLESRVCGEAIRTWIKEIASLRKAVSIWDRVQARNQEWLEARIQWRRGADGFPFVVYEDPEKPEDLVPGDMNIAHVITNSKDDVEANWLLQSKDTFNAAKVLVTRLINKRLAEHTCSKLLFDGLEPSLHIVPWNLLGALWLQFARSTSDRWPYRQCGHCRDWMQVAPQGLERPGAYCSDSCRSKAYRARLKMPVERPRRSTRHGVAKRGGGR